MNSQSYENKYRTPLSTNYSKDQAIYGEIFDVSSQFRIGILNLPCQFGRSTKIINNQFHLNDHNTINIYHKVNLSTCPCISSSHFILFYNFTNSKLELKALSDMYFNNEPIAEDSETIQVNNFDRLSFSCPFENEHIYILLFPNLAKPEKVVIQSKPIVPLTTVNGNKTDLSLSNSWTIHEKDSLRKFILIYGYGKWSLIQKNSAGVLTDKSQYEIRLFSNSFLRTIIDLLPSDRKDLKKFLNDLIEEKENEPIVLCKKDDWGTLIKQRAPAWGKRLQLIWRVSILIEKFKSEKRKNKEIRTKHQLTNDDSDLININKTFDHWDNLLNFLPSQALYGQKPATWWTRTHDIDLLRGTYKYGYANYNLMRQDPKLSFSKLDKESNYQDFPSADNLTRRLKKLIQIIVKYEQSNNGVISFVEKKITKDPTGFSLEEKNDILKYLIDKGIPINSEGKNDFNLLKDDLLNSYKIESKHTSHEYERLIQRLQMISQIVINLENNSNEASMDDNQLDELDPDNDNFIITPEDAELLIKNMSLLSFIRKVILFSNAKLFFAAVPAIKISEYSNLPTEWEPEVHDKELLYSISNNGFSSCGQLVESEQFINFHLTSDDLNFRLNFLCEFFKEFTSSSKQKKKKEIISLQNEIINTQYNPSSGIINLNQLSGNKKKVKGNFVDESGEIIYPVNISSALTIINFGTIEYERINYHSEKNFFPIGYISLREHISMINPPNRCLYTCEIFDGGLRPIFQLTCHDDPSHPIVKDSCTGCWIVVCSRINDIQKNRKSKVTISGTERFGLCDNNVCKILQSLPNAEKCKKYVMKSFN